MRLNCLIFLLHFYLIKFTCQAAGLPMSIWEQKKIQTTSESQGLYDANDNVISLNGNNLKIKVFGKKHASLVEFYNSYCGACRRFAIIYKAFSDDIYSWRDIVLVTAIDCSKDENNGICREFEVMSYPTIRYFSPNYQDGTNQIGVEIKGKDVPLLREALMEKLIEDPEKLSTWPHLEKTSNINNENIFNDLSHSIQYAFLITEPEKSLVGADVILDLHSITEIVVKRNTGTKISVQAFSRNDNFINLTTTDSRESIVQSIKQFLKNHNINILTYSDKTEQDDNINGNPNKTDFEQNSSLFEKKLKLYKDKIFYDDLEQALKYTIFHEISGTTIINGEKLLALQSYLTVIAKYFPSGTNGRNFLRELRDSVLNTTTTITGADFSNKANQLQLKWIPVFSTTRWVRCHSDIQGLRNFPCGLWIMFHYLSVRATESNKSSDSLEVLQAMSRYVKNYFGCHDCSGHFQEMSARRKIWNVTSKDEVILWIWESHNEVNNRLAGDITEDPAHPKIQFPSIESCSNCRKQTLNGDINNDSIEWNKTEVLFYLKQIYALENLVTFNLENEELLPQPQRTLSSVFSDLDMRMGMLLYIFCVCMMIIAVKLFKRRGYRKKMYVHDLLGKV